MLPFEFTQRMHLMLGDEYTAFEEAFQQQKFQALRINSLKAGKEFADKCDFISEAVPWAENCFYFDINERPGKNPLHEAGLYYIQEPSAMAPVHFMQIEPGERILDLCAAPGGKTTQIAAAMAGKGILVTNEINAARAKILSLNVERMGIANAMVTNETPEKLANHFEAYFDKILVDAPCSGEGMFRKNEEAEKQWSSENVKLCSERQAEILECAERMLSSGGTIVYSTCTFSPEENEGSISSFLERHHDFCLIPTDKTAGMEGGRPEWVKFSKNNIIDNGDVLKQNIDYCVRMWPHKVRGEGHFMAVLKREGEAHCFDNNFCPNGIQAGVGKDKLKPWLEFQKLFLRKEIKGIFYKFGDQLYCAPENMPSTDGLRVLRSGLHLGTFVKDRFEPSHALALSMKKEDAVISFDLSSEELTVRQYLNGQTFRASAQNGWCLVTVDGYSIGWGKSNNGMIKNHYPKGLRIPYV